MVDDNLLEEIQDAFSNSIKREDSTYFATKLFEDMINSVNEISLNNNYLINLVSLFDYSDKFISFSNLEDSVSNNILSKLSNLSDKQIKILLNTLIYIKNKLTKDELDLCIDELNRGIVTVKWVLEEKELYTDLFQLFDTNLILEKDEIISREFQGTDTQQEQYFIDLISRKHWVDIENESILNFLEGLDFYYLSDKAYYFMLPACIKYSLSFFENNSDSLLLEWIVVFLSDTNRINKSSELIRLFIIRYLKLIEKLESITAYGWGMDEYFCLGLWNGMSRKQAKEYARQAVACM